MSEADDTQKLKELDQLLNDPTVPLDPSRIWVLLGEIARYSPRTLAKEGSLPALSLTRAAPGWSDQTPMGRAEASVR
jgi:hypothetical protein